MRRFLPASLLFVVLAASPSFADPGVSVRYHDELLRVTLDGSYAGTYYRIWRSGEFVGEYDPMASRYTLCTGECFLTDQEALPGRTYYYSFELMPPDGQIVWYGPYAISIPDTPFGARIRPNPSKGAVTIELSAPGSRRRDAPVQAAANILDLQGRVVRMLYSGWLPRGVTTVTWDGRSEAGRQIGAGIYFVHVTTPLGASTTRLVRVR
jgi:hypothetical protein